MWPHRRQPTSLPRPWDSPGKNTGVGCHFLLQCMKVKSESEVSQSCPTLRHPMNCSPPGSSICGIFQARGLEWGAIAFSLWSGVSHKLPMWFKTRESDNSSTYMNCCFILFWLKGYSGELRYPLLQSVFSPNLGQTMVIYLQLAIASIFAAHFKNGRPSGTSNAFSSWEKSGRGPLPLGDQYPGNLTL